MEEQKEILKKYAEIKDVVKRCEAQIEEMKPQIVDIISKLNPGEDEHPVEVEGIGKFSCVQKRKYSYSTETRVLEDKVKEVKKTEEQNGVATYIINPYLKFDPVKEPDTE